MIDLYTWPTPNGRKISILLEELKIPYKVHLIDINNNCLLYTSPSPRDRTRSRMPSSA